MVSMYLLKTCSISYLTTTVYLNRGETGVKYGAYDLAYHIINLVYICLCNVILYHKLHKF